MSDSGTTVPEGFGTLTPYLVVDDATEAIDFYVRAFGATETFRVSRPDGRVGHTELRIGGSPLMLTETHPDYPFMQSASQLGGSPVQMYLYLPDADATYRQALECGAEVVMQIEDATDGDRRGGIRDPFGILWWIASALDPDAREKLNERDTSAG